MDLPENICLVLCWMKEETSILVSPVCRPIFVAPLHWLEFTVVKLLRKIRGKSTTGWWFQSMLKKRVPHATNASLNPMECRESLLICLMIGDPFPWTSDPILQHLRVRTVWVILMCFLFFWKRGGWVFQKWVLRWRLFYLFWYRESWMSFLIVHSRPLFVWYRWWNDYD